MLNYTNLIELCGSSTEAIKTLLSWDAYDYVMLNNIVDSMKCGIREEIMTYCPKCHSPIRLQWHFKETDLVNKIPIHEIFRNILSISKYTNFQITDDMAYGEVEVMSQVVSQMIEEENKEYDKANNNSTTLFAG